MCQATRQAAPSLQTQPKDAFRRSLKIRPQKLFLQHFNYLLSIQPLSDVRYHLVRAIQF